MAAHIQSYCTINSATIKLDGNVAFEGENSLAQDFFRAAYRNLQLDYPKFYKMDNLTKLAFLGTEYLLKNIAISPVNQDLAMCFINKTSSLESDWKHQDLINQNKNVSPSVFVYTLPNILMGEIAIRNEWYGENLFLIEPEFSLDSWLAEADRFFDLNKAKYCLGGWVDFFENGYDLKLFLASKEKSNHAFLIETVKQELKL